MISPKRSLVPILICAMLHGSPSHAQSPADPNRRTVDVTGHGDANAKPDAMIVSFAVDNQAATADECTQAHAEKVRKIIAALKGKLGDDAKIETADYSLNPNTIYVNAPASEAPPAKESWRFAAEVTANSDALEMMGTFVDSAMAAGATRLKQSGMSEIPEEAAATGDARGVYLRSMREGIPPKMKQVAFVTVEVEAFGTSATDAARAGSPRVAQVQKVLKQQVGDHGTVELSQFNIMQVDPNQNRLPAPPPQPPIQQVQNFAAHTTVTAETSKLELLGPVVQAALDNGATRLNQVQFTLHNDSQARKEAIEKASAEAKTKAESVAKSMGVRLGKILRISTNGQVRPQIIYGNTYPLARMSEAHAFSAASVSVPVLPHEVGFSADVTVDYEIE
jgi:uncharacterized protein YggE